MDEQPGGSRPAVADRNGDERYPVRQPYARGDLVHELFAGCARQRPAAVALIHGETRMTYGGLDSASDHLAARLADHRVGSGDTVPVILPRSVELVVALLAVLKRGAAYTALDPRWPARRLDSLLRRIAPRVVVTGPPTALTASTVAGSRNPKASQAGITGEQACAVFFTSGSTGEPKGVVSPHRGTVRLFQDCAFARFGPGTIMPLAASVPWDAFSLELWSVLMNGGTCVVVDEPYLSPVGLRAAVAEHGVNSLSLTASLFNLFVDEDLPSFAGLEQVFVGAEKVSAAHLGRFLDAHPSVRLVHCYGPAESTIFTTTHQVVRADCDRVDGVPIGRPVPNTCVTVWNGTAPCAPGEVGELLIAGDGLALGYLDDPDLTAEKFPTLRLDGAERHVYRTGDLAHTDPDGTLHFDGRADRQIKLRGHRIEPAETENAAGRLSWVQHCTALPVPDPAGGYRGLALFYRVATAPERADDELMAHLRRELPHYLVPRWLRRLDTFPLNGNGKLDTRAMLAGLPEAPSLPAPQLPAPEPPAPQPAGSQSAAVQSAVPALTASPLEVSPSAVSPSLTSLSVAAPAGAAAGRLAGGSYEEITADVCGSVFGLASVPPDAFFHDLGGDSLGIARLATRLTTALGTPVPLSAVARNPTVRSLARWLREAAGTGRVPPTPRGTSGPVLLAPIQFFFWARQAANPDERSYNCSMAWWIDGPLDAGALRQALTDLHLRHEALRAAYKRPHPEQHPVADLSGHHDEPDIRAPVRCPDEPATFRHILSTLDEVFDLGAGRIWRGATAVSVSTGRTLLGISVHHVAFDGWSEAVLTAELGHCYGERLAGRAPTFPRTAPSLAAMAAQRQAELAVVDLDRQRRYWQGQLSGIPELATPVSADLSTTPGVLVDEYRLDAAAWAQVANAAARERTTPFTVLLHRYATALQAATGQSEFGIGVPIVRRGNDTSAAAVGCLIDMLTMRMQLPEPDIHPTGPADIHTTSPADIHPIGRADLHPTGLAGGHPTGPVRTGLVSAGLASVHRTVVDALANQDVPFVELVRMGGNSGSGRTPLHQTMFALQQNQRPQLRLPGCATEFVHLPRRHAPFELITEVWPEPEGGARVEITYQIDRVPAGFVEEVARRFLAAHGADRNPNGQATQSPDRTAAEGADRTATQDVDGPAAHGIDGAVGRGAGGPAARMGERTGTAVSPDGRAPRERAVQDQMMRLLHGELVTQLLVVAAGYGVADLLADGPRPVAELAERCGAHPRSLYRVLRALASVEVFTEVEPGTFDLTPLAATLRTGVPGSMRAWTRLWGLPERHQAFAALSYSVQTGQPAFPHLYGTDWWSHLASAPDQAALFNDAMGDLAREIHAAAIEKYDLTGVRRLVDVGGGHGHLVAAILHRYPDLTAVVLDRPAVLAGAREALAAAGTIERSEVTASSVEPRGRGGFDRKGEAGTIERSEVTASSVEPRGRGGFDRKGEAGMTERVTLVGGDFFTAVPAGADAYLLSMILHDWDDERAVAILSNIRSAMSPDAQVIVIDAVLPEGDTPHDGKLRDAIMLALHPGRERTEAEFVELFAAAGLRHVRTVAVSASTGLLVAKAARSQPMTGTRFAPAA